MIISASYRTDIPAFYGEWFINRLGAGTVGVVNPYGGPPGRIRLTRDTVDGFVFWTRNLGPFLPALRAVRERGFPFTIQYTMTGYPRPLDAATIPPDAAIAQIRRAVDAFGGGGVVWRYDPIVFTTLTPPSWHRDSFRSLARALDGRVDEAVVSFAHIYRKTARNMASAARAFGFDWWDPSADEKRHLLAALATIGAEHDIRLTLCGQPELLTDGVGEARCIDARRLGRIADRPLDVVQKPHRGSCRCWASRDIGAYDSCPHGCVYCYAVNGRDAAKLRFQRHDPMSEFLISPTGQPG